MLKVAATQESRCLVAAEPAPALTWELCQSKSYLGNDIDPKVLELYGRGYFSGDFLFF
jgi:hypothetical protein